MSKKILLVDDDQDIVRGSSLRLRAVGYETYTAGDGNEGVSAAHQYHPDAIVLDVRMPEKDGITALGELKQAQDTQNIPVIMLSASIVDQGRALDTGARFFLKKPYNGKELVGAIEAAINDAAAVGV